MPKLLSPGDGDLRFTVANQTVYAFGYRGFQMQSRLVNFASGSAEIERVNLLGLTAPLSFYQTKEALLVTLPWGETSTKLPYVLRLQGKMPLGLA